MLKVYKAPEPVYFENIAVEIKVLEQDYGKLLSPLTQQEIESLFVLIKVKRGTDMSAYDAWEKLATIGKLDYYKTDLGSLAEKGERVLTQGVYDDNFAKVIDELFRIDQDLPDDRIAKLLIEWKTPRNFFEQVNLLYAPFCPANLERAIQIWKASRVNHPRKRPTKQP